jgi:metal-responsive CopG/Arc/MetJ family transcriptional regulator
MAGKRIEVELPDQLYSDLEEIAETLGISDLREALVIGLAEWASRRKSELDDRDPSQRYFVNEALDELEKKK